MQQTRWAVVVPNERTGFQVARVNEVHGDNWFVTLPACLTNAVIGPHSIIAIHPTAYSAVKACEAAKITETVLREPWKRALELTAHLEAYMVEGTREAAAVVYVEPQELTSE